MPRYTPPFLRKHASIVHMQSYYDKSITLCKLPCERVVFTDYRAMATCKKCLGVKQRLGKPPITAPPGAGLLQERLSKTSGRTLPMLSRLQDQRRRTSESDFEAKVERHYRKYILGEKSSARKKD